jgi:hypothetical protein
LATVGGSVFFDENLNSVRDAGEPGLAGITIYDDDDNDGVHDVGDESAVSSGAAGSYEFQVAFPYDLLLRAKPPTGLAVTTPLLAQLTSQERAAGFGAVAVAAGRFDAGASLDLIVANSGVNTLSLYANNGAGVFAAPVSVVVGQGPAVLAVADFNRDGADDVAVGYANLSFVTILRGNGAGGFIRLDVPVGSGPRSLVAADLNGDGYEDLAAVNSFSDTASVLLNNKSASVGFAPAASFATANGPAYVDVGRFNADAAPDLAVVTADVARIYLNNGAGGFAPAAQFSLVTGSDPVAGVGVGDLDGDSFADIVVALVSGNAEVRRGNATGGLSAGPTLIFGTFMSGLDLIDVDADGDPDPVAVEQSEQAGLTGKIFIKRNNGGTFDNGFSNIGSLPFELPNQIAAGDFNEDGVTDVAVAWQSSATGSGRLTVHTSQLVADKHGVGIFGGTPDPDFGIGPLVSSASRAGGDYNGDVVVNGADLGMWTANFGRTVGLGLAADGNQNVRVDGGDFLLWQRRLGSTVPAATPALAAASSEERPQPGALSALAQAFAQFTAAAGRGAVGAAVAPHAAELGDVARSASRLPKAVSSPTIPARRDLLQPLSSPDRAALAAEDDLASFDAALTEFDTLFRRLF